MKIDCSKLSNKDDLMMIIGLLVIGFFIFVAIYLALNVDSFAAGFFSATVTWKWHGWIYMPIDRRLDKLWTKN